jgi:hypothetical protein
MSILIQNPATGFYLRWDGLWTKRAESFKFPGDALYLCRRYHITEFQEVLKCQRPQFELVISSNDVKKLVGPAGIENRMEEIE